VYTRVAETPRWWVLAKRGEVAQVTANGESFESIPDAGTGPTRHGYVNKMALIGGELYVCGYQRQVYRREQDRWVHIDHGILAPTDSQGIGFESMDGTGANNIYAVGWEGEIYRYDGKLWHSIDSPTNVQLFEVHCVNEELVYACGQKGIVVRGAGSRWQVLQNEDFVEDLWGVVSFQGHVYVAGFGGVARIESDDIVPIDMGFGKLIAGYRLRAAPGLLWSIGNDHLVRRSDRSRAARLPNQKDCSAPCSWQTFATHPLGALTRAPRMFCGVWFFRRPAPPWAL
jgi:hypothetical protein